MTSETVLEVRNLKKAFGRQRALDGVSFSVRRGDVFGFLGLNGAGKTTTLRIVVDLLREDEGEVALFGRKNRSDRRRALARVGAMVEGPAFYDHLTGRENLLWLARLGGPIEKDAVDAILEKVGLAPAAGRRAREYSLGMKQRLGIALALVARPEFVILDEPTNGLDPNGIKEMRELIARLNKEDGVTFLVSSHLLHEIELIADRVAILERGKVLIESAVGPLLDSMGGEWLLEADPKEGARAAIAAFPFVADLRDLGKNRLAFRAPADRTAAVVAELVGRGIRVHRLEERRPTLEEYFLERSTARTEGKLT